MDRGRLIDGIGEGRVARGRGMRRASVGHGKVLGNGGDVTGDYAVERLGDGDWPANAVCHASDRGANPAIGRGADGGLRPHNGLQCNRLAACPLRRTGQLPPPR